MPTSYGPCRSGAAAAEPATWERDEDAVLRYEQETSLLFEAEFGAAGAAGTRDLFALRGLTDRDLDAFYRRPSNAFEIGSSLGDWRCWRSGSRN